MNSPLPEIKIEGRSGCRLDIVRSNEQIRVRKYSSGIPYNSRLQKQQQKQQQFNTLQINNLGFFTPGVFADGTEQGLYWFEMSYTGGDKYSTYFTVINKEKLDGLIRQFLAYFDAGIRNSPAEAVETAVITDKIKSLKESFKHDERIPATLAENVTEYLESNIPSSPLYQGKCHGDFTLSNMLFTPDGRIITFDLLDSFIESPVIDLVKLRQDTRHHWSLFVENEHSPNNTKIRQVLAYIDKHLLNTVCDDPCIKIWEKYLTVFNFARILPYAKDMRDINYLNHHLTTILNE